MIVIFVMTVEEIQNDVFSGTFGEYVNTAALWDPEYVEPVVQLLHKMALKELLSRNVLSVWDWEIRTRHMFETNKMVVVGDLVHKTQEDVRKLIGCGDVTKKEVYEAFMTYHIRLKFWKSRIATSHNEYKF